MPTVLDYLRHGEPVGGGRYRGHNIDDPLSDKGWAQMRATTHNFAGWTRIITSPLTRCSEFADWLGQQRKLPVEVHNDLKEIGFGTWEGTTRAELMATRHQEYQAFYQDPVNNRPQGAEPLGQFGARIAAVFEHLIDQYPDEYLLVITHAGVIRATLGHVIQATAQNWYQVQVDNAALSQFAHDEYGNKLVIHNWRPMH
jgi:alpha-ribazole phosphatase